MVGPSAGKECAGVVEVLSLPHRQWVKSSRTNEILVELQRGGHADRDTADVGLAQGIAKRQIVILSRHLRMAE